MIHILNKGTALIAGKISCPTTFCLFPIKCTFLRNLSYFTMSPNDISIKFHLLFDGLSVMPLLSFFCMMSPIIDMPLHSFFSLMSPIQPPYIDMSGIFFCYKFPAVYTSLQN